GVRDQFLACGPDDLAQLGDHLTEEPNRPADRRHPLLAPLNGRRRAALAGGVAVGVRRGAVNRTAARASTLTPGGGRGRTRRTVLAHPVLRLPLGVVVTHHVLLRCRRRSALTVSGSAYQA